MNIIVHYTSVQGRRNANEDRHNIKLNIDKNNPKLNSINMLGIYDGHGGTHVSEFLEKNLPKYYCDVNLEPPFSQEYHCDLFESLQNKLLETKNGYRCGSTCLLNLMYKYFNEKTNENEIHMNIINLGDCRLVIVYSNGSCKQVTTDHKPDDPKEKIRIEKIGGEVYADSEGTIRVGDLSVSKAFGDGDNAPYISQKPDVFYKRITCETKYVVMGCDGLWDVIENKNLFNLLNKFKESGSKNLASDLAQEALKRGTTDNVSVIIIEIENNK
jgi:serine/threonine protein phosphatase PrpC